MAHFLLLLLFYVCSDGLLFLVRFPMRKRIKKKKADEEFDVKGKWVFTKSKTKLILCAFCCPLVPHIRNMIYTAKKYSIFNDFCYSTWCSFIFSYCFHIYRRKRFDEKSHSLGLGLGLFVGVVVGLHWIMPDTFNSEHVRFDIAKAFVVLAMCFTLLFIVHWKSLESNWQICHLLFM